MGCRRVAVPSEDAIAWPGSTEVRAAATPGKRRSLAGRRCYSWSVATVVTHLRLRGSSCNLRLLLTLIGGLKVKAGTGGGDLADKNSGEIPICHSPNVGRDRSPRLQLRAGAVLCCGSHWPLGGNADGFKGRIDSGLIAGHDRHAEALHQQSAAGISFDQLGHRKSITGILPNSI